MSVLDCVSLCDALQRSGPNSAAAARKKHRIENLICLAAEVHERIYRRRVGEFSLIKKELESIIATHAPQPRGSRALTRYIE
jgi:hypothetical protein